MRKGVFIVFITMISLFVVTAQSSIADPIQEPIVPYRLFKTTNRWTFIELETATDRMWQLQYDTQGDNRGAVVLNADDLTEDKDYISGRFTLYPTENMWTFILLDQVDGSSWQVQWSFEEKKSFCYSYMQVRGMIVTWNYKLYNN